jgi:hypothetical protein
MIKRKKYLKKIKQKIILKKLELAQVNSQNSWFK